jgi:subtilisin family serine protease
MRTTLLAAALVILAAVGASSARALEQPIDPAIAAELAAAGRAHVIVAFATDPGADLHYARTRAQRRDLGATASLILAGVSAADFEPTGALQTVGLMRGWATETGLQQLLADPRVRGVSLDRPLAYQLAEAVPLVTLDALHDRELTGTGTVVAVVDGGIDPDHPDLADALVGEICFCTSPTGGCCPDGTTQQEGPGSAGDVDGHGTSVSGIITSNGIEAPLGGAPGASILAVKTRGPALEDGTEFDVLLAGDWIIRERPDVAFINLSLATLELFPSPCDQANPTTVGASLLVGALRERGVLVIASAGNEGASDMLGLPACLSGIVAVGATHDAGPDVDQVTSWSNSDATIDVVAPGDATETTALGGGSWDFSGTSAAAPLVTACAAVLDEAFPEATVDQLRDALGISRTHTIDPKNGLEFPRLDCEAAWLALPEPAHALLLVAGTLALFGVHRLRTGRAAA